MLSVKRLAIYNIYLDPANRGIPLNLYKQCTDVLKSARIIIGFNRSKEYDFTFCKLYQSNIFI